MNTVLNHSKNTKNIAWAVTFIMLVSFLPYMKQLIVFMLIKLYEFLIKAVS